jgi:hypothetical protein
MITKNNCPYNRTGGGKRNKRSAHINWYNDQTPTATLLTAETLEKSRGFFLAFVGTLLNRGNQNGKRSNNGQSVSKVGISTKNILNPYTVEKTKKEQLTHVWLFPVRFRL